MPNKLLTILICSTLCFYGCSKSDVINGSGNNTPNDKPVGSSANDLLSAAKFQSIQLEIAYMPGYAPDAAALNNLVTFLNTLVNKPDGIQVTQRQIAVSGKSILNLVDIKTIENDNRTIFNNGTSLGIFMLFADADYNEENTLGVAYKNTSMVIFGKKVHENSGGLNQSTLTRLESTVEQHEFGHLLGLVDLGSPMQAAHVDVAHNHHCTNTSCLMYYATQLNMMGGIILSGPVPSLDTDCRNDLRANGGK